MVAEFDGKQHGLTAGRQGVAVLERDPERPSVAKGQLGYQGGISGEKTHRPRGPAVLLHSNDGPNSSRNLWE